jgi:hypothetical protein
MDMVGGGPETKSVFHVSGGPGSLPSFVYDVGQAFGAFVNEQTYKYAATGSATYPLVSPHGGKEPLLAQLDEFDMGSDHEIYSSSSWGIPAIYLHDWPDRYIHTTWDTPDKIDPTKLLRAAFIGAASGYFLAFTTPTTPGTSRLWLVMSAAGARRSAKNTVRESALSGEDAAFFRDFYRQYNATVSASAFDFSGVPMPTPRILGKAPSAPDNGPRFVRNEAIRGPMSVFGYDYLSDKLGAEKTSKLKLLEFTGLRGTGGDYAYEVLNLVQNPSTARQVRNNVSGIYGPVPLELVTEYLNALVEAGVVRQIK